MDGVALTEPVTPPIGFAVERFTLAAGDDTLMIVANDITGRRARLLSGSLVGRELPTSWSAKKLPDRVWATFKLTSGYRGVSAVLAPDALLVAAIPDVTVVDPGTGRLLFDGPAPQRAPHPCGVSGASAWTGTGLLVWGGQTCDASGAQTSAEGLLWTPSRR